MTAATAIPTPRPALAPVDMSRLYRCEIGEARLGGGKTVRRTAREADGRNGVMAKGSPSVGYDVSRWKGCGWEMPPVGVVLVR